MLVGYYTHMVMNTHIPTAQCTNENIKRVDWSGKSPLLALPT